MGRRLKLVSVFMLSLFFLNASAPVLAVAAQELPASYPTMLNEQETQETKQVIPLNTEEEVIETPQLEEVRLDILTSRLNIQNGYVCGLGNYLLDDGIEVTIQNWNSEYLLQWRISQDKGEFSQWANALEYPNAVFTQNEGNANLFLPHAEDIENSHRQIEIRAVNADMEVVSNLATLEFKVTSDPASLACNGKIDFNFTVEGNESLSCGIESEVNTYIVSWTSIENATNYAVDLLEKVGDTWMPVELNINIQAINYVINENEFVNIDEENDIVKFSTRHPEAGTYTYYIEALDSEGKLIANSAAPSNESCTITLTETIDEEPRGSIVVRQVVLDIEGQEINSNEIFTANLLLENEIVQSKQVTTGTQTSFSVLPGSYAVSISGNDNYTNLGCYLDGTESSIINIEADQNLIVYCTVQMVEVVEEDTKPMVTISSSPSNLTTEPTKIKLRANVTGGNGTITYKWLCGNGVGDTIQEIILSKVGTYECSVTVTDEDGDTAVAGGTFIIKKYTAPKPTFTGGGSGASNNNAGSPSTAAGNGSENGGSVNGDGVSTDDDENVLGLEAQVCDIRSTVSGYVFIDSQVNNGKDPDERGLNGIDLVIFYNSQNEDGDTEEKEVRRITTNNLGRWETRLCPGKYMVRVETSDLPENINLGGGDRLEFTVVEGQNNENVSFAAYEDGQGNGGFNWLLCLIPFTLLILLAGAYSIFSSARSRTAKTQTQGTTTTPLNTQNETVDEKKGARTRQNRSSSSGSTKDSPPKKSRRT